MQNLKKQRNGFSINWEVIGSQSRFFNSHFDEIHTISENYFPKIVKSNGSITKSQAPNKSKLEQIIGLSFQLYHQFCLSSMKFMQDEILSFYKAQIPYLDYREIKQDLENKIALFEVFKKIITHLTGKLDFFDSTFGIIVGKNKLISYIETAKKDLRTIIRIGQQLNKHKDHLLNKIRLKSLQEKREVVLKDIIYSKKPIFIEKLAPLLEFNYPVDLELWLLKFPSELFKIDDNLIIFNRNQTDEDVSFFISDLLNKFKEFEELSLGKKE